MKYSSLLCLLRTTALLSPSPFQEFEIKTKIIAIKCIIRRISFTRIPIYLLIVKKFFNETGSARNGFGNGFGKPKSMFTQSISNSLPVICFRKLLEIDCVNMLTDTIATLFSYLQIVIYSSRFLSFRLNTFILIIH